MSQSIEAKIHNILLDIDPSLHDEYEDQSIVIAEAAANYRLSQKTEGIKTASKKEQASAEEALVIDCLLQAMNTLMEHNTRTARYALADVSIDGDEVDYETILRTVRFATKDFGNMDILNDDDMSSFLENGERDVLFGIEDIFDDEHDPELFGSKKHRSDSLRR